jgi:hypothetical protein
LVFQVHPNTKPSEKNKIKAESMWLVAPLISKLPSAIQGRVLKAAGKSGVSGYGSRWILAVVVVVFFFKKKKR